MACSYAILCLIPSHRVATPAVVRLYRNSVVDTSECFVNKIILWCVVGFVVAFVIAFGLGAWAASLGTSFGIAPWILGGLLGAFTALIGGNLAGNRKVAMASGEARDAALSFQPAPGHALLVIYREGFVGMAAGMNVHLDGRPVAQLKSPRFTALNLTPGDHTVAFGFGGLAGAQNHQAEVVVPAVAGQVIALKATMAMGALKNSIAVEWVEAYPSDLRQTLAGMKMVAADQSAA